MTKARVDSKGRITIPRNIREKMNIRKGIVISIIPKNDYIILCKLSSASEFKGAADGLAQQIVRYGRIRTEKLF